MGCHSPLTRHSAARRAAAARPRERRPAVEAAVSTDGASDAGPANRTRARCAGVDFRAMIDHIKLHVADAERSKAFYAEALAPLRLPRDHGAGRRARSSAWARAFRTSGSRSPTTPTVAHVALRADDREAVDAFHAAALAAGGRDNGGARPAAAVPPGLLRRLRLGPRRQQRRGRAPHVRRLIPARDALRTTAGPGPAVCGRYGPLPRSTALVFVPAAPRGWRAIHCSTW